LNSALNSFTQSPWKKVPNSPSVKVAEPLVLVQLAKLSNNLTNQSKLKTHPLKDGFLFFEKAKDYCLLTAGTK